MRVVRHRNRFSREVVDASCLQASKVNLVVALSNQLYWKVSLATAGSLELDALGRSLQSQAFHDSVEEQ